jgi:hypothetical protein
MGLAHSPVRSAMEYPKAAGFSPHYGFVTLYANTPVGSVGKGTPRWEGTT